MKQRTLLIITLLLLILLIAGCTTGGRYNKNPAKFMNSRGGVDYHTGTDGLVFSFLDQSPPFSVFEGAEFDVQAIIHNNGAFDVAGQYAATINLIYDNNLIERMTDEAPDVYVQDGMIQVYGKSYFYPQGEQNYFPLERFRVKPFDSLHETKSVKFTAILTYPYQTHFSDEVCIDTDPEGVSGRQEACNVADRKYSGQGAPIAITAVENQMVPRGYYVQPQFTIHIENRGKGLVWNYDENHLRQASNVNPLTNIFPRMVDLQAPLEPNLIEAQAHLGVNELRCSPVYMKEGKAKIQCILPENSIAANAANYITTLSVNLSYFYQETFTKEVEVKRSTVYELEEIPKYDYCAPWEQLVPTVTGDQRCESLCTIYARGNQGELSGRGLRLEENYVQYVDCIYTDPTICRNTEGSCIVESRGLCQTGKYCGWPSCLDYNQPPYLYKQGSVWIEGTNVYFVCKDGDDIYDKLGVCDCAPKAYYALKQGDEHCDEIIQSSFREIPGQYSRQFGMKFTLTGMAENIKNLCIILEDKQGLQSEAMDAWDYVRD